MLIKVTRDHIMRGVRVSVSGCPIGLAIQETTGFTYEVSHCHAHRSGDITVVRLPPSAKRFISDFDGGWEVSPFEFELPVEAT
jgi:hypothetical protein